jgi:hypothetical protein
MVQRYTSRQRSTIVLRACRLTSFIYQHLKGYNESDRTPPYWSFDYPLPIRSESFMLCLLFVLYAYSYVGFKSSLELVWLIASFRLRSNDMRAIQWSDLISSPEFTDFKSFKNVPSWSWSYGSLIYNYLCNQCLSPLKLWVRTPFMARCTRCNIMW